MCSVTWPTDTRIAVQWLTRKQNYVIVQIYDFDGSSWREKQVSDAFPFREPVTVSQLTSSYYHKFKFKINSLLVFAP